MCCQGRPEGGGRGKIALGAKILEVPNFQNLSFIIQEIGILARKKAIIPSRKKSAPVCCLTFQNSKL